MGFGTLMLGLTPHFKVFTVLVSEDFEHFLSYAIKSLERKCLEQILKVSTLSSFLNPHIAFHANTWSFFGNLKMNAKVLDIYIP